MGPHRDLKQCFPHSTDAFSDEQPSLLLTDSPAVDSCSRTDKQTNRSDPICWVQMQYTNVQQTKDIFNMMCYLFVTVVREKMRHFLHLIVLLLNKSVFLLNYSNDMYRRLLCTHGNLNKVSNDDGFRTMSDQNNKSPRTTCPKVGLKWACGRVEQPLLNINI